MKFLNISNWNISSCISSYNYSSTPIRRQHDQSTTYVTTTRLPVCALRPT